MNKENELKLLMDRLEEDERFLLVEYEGLFVKEGDKYRLKSDFALYLDNEWLFSLSREEVGKDVEEPVIETLVKRLYDVLNVEIIELKKLRKTEQMLQEKINIKTERVERQNRKSALVIKQKVVLTKELEKLDVEINAVKKRIAVILEQSPEVKLIGHLEELRKTMKSN